MNKRHYSAELQTAKQTPKTSKILIEVTYGDFPCHLKVKRDKLALINLLWCKKGKRLRITANSFTKIDQPDGFRPLGCSRRENSSRFILFIHSLLTTSPKGLFSANYKEEGKNKNIYKLFKVTIANH